MHACTTSAKLNQKYSTHPIRCCQTAYWPILLFNKLVLSLCFVMNSGLETSFIRYKYSFKLQLRRNAMEMQRSKTCLFVKTATILPSNGILLTQLTNALLIDPCHETNELSDQLRTADWTNYAHRPKQFLRLFTLYILITIGLF